MSNMSAIFHTVAAVFHIYALIYPYYHALPMPKGFSGRLKFLTIWAHGLQVGYYVFAILLDIYTAYKGYMCHKLKGIRDHWFSILVFPLSLLVFTLFWGIYAIDRELIFPRKMEAILPPVYNHMLHTLIIFWASIEVVVTDISVPKKRNGMLAILIFTLSYMVWSYIVFLNIGKWAYPFLNTMSNGQLAMFFFATYILICVLYHVTTTLQYKFGKTVKHVVKVE